MGENQISMPKNYSQYYAKNKKHSKFRRFLIVLFWIVVATGVVLLGRFISDMLTGNLSFFSSSKIKVSAESYYILQFGEFDNLTDARECAVWVENAGGAGYIEKGDKYIVIGRPYFTQSDGEKVKENMGVLKYDANILKLSSAKISLQIKGVKKSDKKAILNGLNSINKFIKEVDEIDRNIDQNLFTNIGACNELSGLKTKVREVKNSLSLINLNYSNSGLNSVVSYFSQVEDSLDFAINKLLVSTMESGVCKYLLSDMVLKYVNLTTTLA